jgi:hypothetical protein
MRPFLRLVEAILGDRVRKKILWYWFPRSIEPAAGDDPSNNKEEKGNTDQRCDRGRREEKVPPSKEA